MMNFAPGSLLAQLQDLSASAQLAYSAVQQTEIQAINICNTLSGTAQFYIYHDDGGNRYSAGTALHFSEKLPGNTTKLLRSNEMGTGFTVKAGGSLGVQSDLTGAFTFSIYGTTRAGR